MVRNFIGLGKALLFLVTIGNSFLVLAIPHDTIYEIKKSIIGDYYRGPTQKNRTLVLAIYVRHKKINFQKKTLEPKSRSVGLSLSLSHRTAPPLPWWSPCLDGWCTDATTVRPSHASTTSVGSSSTSRLGWSRARTRRQWSRAWTCSSGGVEEVTLKHV
jgi:hypothetical protein